MKHFPAYSSGLGSHPLPYPGYIQQTTRRAGFASNYFRFTRYIKIALLSVLLTSPVLADKEKTLYEEIEEARLAACDRHARTVLRLLSRGTNQDIMGMSKVGAPFCKWCKDLDKDDYRAVCPK